MQLNHNGRNKESSFKSIPGKGFRECSATLREIADYIAFVQQQPIIFRIKDNQILILGIIHTASRLSKLRALRKVK
jgi:hypothetical protein